MSWGRTVVRAAVSAVVGTGLAVVVNLATSGDYSAWVWGAVVVLTLAVVAVSVWTETSAAPEPIRGIDLGNVKARSFRAKNVKSSGTALRMRRGRFREGIDIEDIESGRGDASHP
ncbi:hypothetical protein [Nocardia bovistercoris]|uniref:Uncharacterized protein n=1 Tax=Nocardia bovistercoris TaxID=2785916 RepID=A0A931N6Q3_9NOCA|nr:hypothetical protein [Nocardia bovistercoris]MBH0780982.1 hypothetical protein [Nocardia bovistercoris]